jgi:hypothetical protein
LAIKLDSYFLNALPTAFSNGYIITTFPEEMQLFHGFAIISA